MKITILYSIFFIITITLYSQDIIEDSVLIEGFYSHGWENSSFYELKDGCINKAIWLTFKQKESYSNFQYDIDKIKNGAAVYLKVKGILRTGSKFGHLGGADAEIIVNEILFLDTTRTLSNFFNQKYCSPIRNSIIEKYVNGGLSLSEPLKGSRISSFTDSLVYPTMPGIIKKVLSSGASKSIIVEHNDTLISVYSNLSIAYDSVGTPVSINKPIGVALKSDNKWQIQFQIWNREWPLNIERLFICNEE